MRYAQQTNAGHGRLEKRRLWMLPIYDDFIAGPGVRLMLRLERTIIHKATGEMSVELEYALSSLDADEIIPNSHNHSLNTCLYSYVFAEFFDK